MLVYAPLLRAEQLALPSADLTAPQVTQENYIDTVKPETNHNITVTVTDNVGVNQVTLYYRAIGTETYSRLSMEKIAKTNNYHVVIDADKIKTPGVEYYVQAMDNAGNSVLHGYSFSPLSVKTDANAASIANASSSTTIETKKSSNTWLWVGLGVLAVGLAASGGSSSSSSNGSSGNDTATLNINASNPNQ